MDANTSIPQDTKGTSAVARGLSLACEGDVAGAIAVLSDAASFEERMLLGSLLSASGEYARALALLRAGLDRGADGLNDVALFHLGVAAVRTEAWEVADRAWGALVSRHPLDAALRGHAARVCWEAVRPHAEVGALKQAAAILGRLCSGSAWGEDVRAWALAMEELAGQDSGVLPGLGSLGRDDRQSAEQAWRASHAYLWDGRVAHALSVLYAQWALALERACCGASEVLDQRGVKAAEMGDPVSIIRRAQEASGGRPCFWDGSASGGHGPGCLSDAECAYVRLCKAAGNAAALWSFAIAHRVHVSRMPAYWEGWIAERLQVYGVSDSPLTAQQMGAALVEEFRHRLAAFENAYRVRGWDALADRMGDLGALLEIENRAAAVTEHLDLPVNVSGRQASFRGGPLLAQYADVTDQVLRRLRALYSDAKQAESARELRMLFSPLARTRTLIERRQFEAAEQSIRRLPRELSSPEGADLAAKAAWGQALALVEVRQWDDALACFSRALHYGPSFLVQVDIVRDLTAAVKREAAALIGRDVDSAIVLVEHARRMIEHSAVHPESGSADHGTEAEQAVERDRQGACLECVRELRELLSVLYCERGICRFNETKTGLFTDAMEEAMGDLERACVLFPGNVKAREQLAVAANQLAKRLSEFEQEYVKAQQVVERGLKRNPNHGELTELLASLKQAAHLAPLHVAMTLIHVNPAQAIVELDRVIKTHPDLVEARDLLLTAYGKHAEQLAQECRYKDALAVLKLAYAKAPERAALLKVRLAALCDRIAGELMRREQWEQAQEVIEEGLSYDPGSTSLGKRKQDNVEASRGSAPGVLRSWREVAAQLPASSSVRSGVELLAAGKREEAVAVCRDFLENENRKGSSGEAILVTKLLDDITEGRV